MIMKLQRSKRIQGTRSIANAFQEKLQGGIEYRVPRGVASVKKDLKRHLHPLQIHIEFTNPHVQRKLLSRFLTECMLSGLAGLAHVWNVAAVAGLGF